MKTALILIDFQMDYFPGGTMELTNPVVTVENAARLLAYCRRQKLAVVHLQHISNRPGASFMLPDTEGVNIHKKVQALSSEKVFTKHSPNGFRDTGLKEYLTKQGINQLILCGMMSHMCVDATVRAAFDLGFECIVAHDACTTKKLQFEEQTINASEVHGAFMAALGAVYAQLLTTDECIKKDPV